MEEFGWVLETIRIWIEGGDWAAIKASRGFEHLVVTLSFLVPSSVIAMGIGVSGWRETPLALWMGVRPEPPDDGWAERARDLDKDGLPDF